MDRTGRARHDRDARGGGGRHRREPGGLSFPGHLGGRSGGGPAQPLGHGAQRAPGQRAELAVGLGQVAAARADRRGPPAPGPAGHRRRQPRQRDLRADGRAAEPQGARREGDRDAAPLDRGARRGPRDPDEQRHGLAAEGRPPPGHVLHLPGPHRARAARGVPHRRVPRGRAAQPRDHRAAPRRRGAPRPRQQHLAGSARPRTRADPRRVHRGPLLGAARREPPAGRAPARRARRRQGRPRLGREGPHHPGRHRRVHRRDLRDRHQGRRTTRPRGRYDGLRQVRAPADDDRLAGRRQPARRVQLRARGLQGRCRLQGLQPPAAHRRDGHRPRRPPHHPRAGVSRRRAPPA